MAVPFSSPQHQDSTGLLLHKLCVGLRFGPSTHQTTCSLVRDCRLSFVIVGKFLILNVQVIDL